MTTATMVIRPGGERISKQLLNVMRATVRHLFKLGALTLALVSLTGLPYRLVGLINKRTGFLQSVFYCYSGDSRYARHYCYLWSERWLKWLPAPISVFRQGGKWGLVLASPVTETDFLDVSNEAQFRLLLRRIDHIAHLVGAAEVNRAGILPSVMYRRFGNISNRLPRLVDVVCDAITRTRALAFGGAEVPIILLGGSGFLGKALHERLSKNDCDVRIVDTAEGISSLPGDLRGRNCLMVDVARRGALAQYVDQLWSGLVILNETFPEPSKGMLRLLAQRGIPVYHLAGTPALILPALPHGYRSCVPCCALHETEFATAVVRKLVLSIPESLEPHR